MGEVVGGWDGKWHHVSKGLACTSPSPGVTNADKGLVLDRLEALPELAGCSGLVTLCGVVLFCPCQNI